MVQVDDIGVGVPQRCMPVRMAVRLRALPAFVLMLVMLIVRVKMFVVGGRVHMLDLDRIAGRPEDQGRKRGCQSHQAKNQTGGG